MKQEEVRRKVPIRSTGCTLGSFSGRFGFTLIELVVTLGLLAIIVFSFFRLYLVGTQAGQHAEELVVATGLTQGHMEDLVSEPTRTWLDDFTRASPVKGIAGYQIRSDVTEEPTGLIRATVSTSWPWSGQVHQTGLTTYITVRARE